MHQTVLELEGFLPIDVQYPVAVWIGAGTARPALDTEQVVEQDSHEAGMEVGVVDLNVEGKDRDPFVRIPIAHDLDVGAGVEGWATKDDDIRWVKTQAFQAGADLGIEAAIFCVPSPAMLEKEIKTMTATRLKEVWATL